ncbi:hypothetical protein FACS1894137_12340 [Spirochaetia bacterium]|nr:hypothetical protein FACS1894137_12340 [Spirochaetia bacterium]
MGLALIDICGTIYNSNTTFDFLDYIFNKNKLYKYVRIIFRAKLLIIINYILLYMFKYDFIRSSLIKFLYGYSRQELILKANCFIDEILNDKKQINVLNVIKNIAINNELILVSSTLDCIAKQVADELCIDKYFASELEYNNNICTGKIKKDYLFLKLDMIQKNGISPLFNVTVSDNISDIELMKQSMFSYIVVSQKNKKKWYKKIEKYALTDYEIIEV